VSIVRDNLMTRRGYKPYCSGDYCRFYCPRTSFNGKQFVCRCGWQTSFEPEFIAAYRSKWYAVEAQP
jgi:hypothetical protein